MTQWVQELSDSGLLGQGVPDSDGQTLKLKQGPDHEGLCRLRTVGWTSSWRQWEPQEFEVAESHEIYGLVKDSTLVEVKD